jgi:predicted CxxxxCH...CXXCH cytochrome family protein
MDNQVWISMMKHIRIASLLAGVAGVTLLIQSCAELKENVPAPTSGGGIVHEEGWNDVTSPIFHGRYLKAQQPPWNDQECIRCHAQSYDGGVSQVSCFTCHPSYPHAAQFPQGLHTLYLRGNMYPLDDCKLCHGADYNGGQIVEAGCMEVKCHEDANEAQKSPEACNTCHGVFRAAASDFLSSSPPKAVAGETDSTFPGVGAHQPHLATGDLGKKVQCQECHTVPMVWNAPGHIDGPPAEVVFNDTLANLTTANGSYTPVNLNYSAATSECSNTYCHGNWVADRASSPNQFGYADSVIVGNNALPVWTSGADGAECGSCHSLPPTGHIAASLSGCAGCHPTVVNSAGEIIDTSKHINGRINVFGAERPF